MDDFRSGKPIEIFVDLENVIPSYETVNKLPKNLNIRFHILRNRYASLNRKFGQAIEGAGFQTHWYGFTQTGKGTLDIILGCLVGITTHAYQSQPVNIYIISADKGYDAMCSLLNDDLRTVRRYDALERIPEYRQAIVSGQKKSVKKSLWPISDFLEGKMGDMKSHDEGLFINDAVLGVNEDLEMVVMHSWRKCKEGMRLYGFTVSASKPDSAKFWKDVWQKEYLGERSQIGILNRLLKVSSSRYAVDLDGIFSCLSNFQYNTVKLAMQADEIDWATSFQMVLHKSCERLAKQKFKVVLFPEFTKWINL